MFYFVKFSLSYVAVEAIRPIYKSFLDQYCPNVREIEFV